MQINSDVLSMKLQEHLANILTEEGESAREAEGIRLMELGFSIMEFAGNNRQVDFVKKEVEGLFSKFNDRVDIVGNAVAASVDSVIQGHFSPDESGSYLKRTADFMRDQLVQFTRDLKALTDSANAVQKLVVENAAKVSTDKVGVVENLFREADKNFAPDNAAGYLGRVRSVIAELQLRLEKELDAQNAGGFAGRLSLGMSTYFGEHSPYHARTQAMLAEFSTAIRAEIVSLREEIARKEGAAAMAETASSKGEVFEEALAIQLNAYAATQQGDTVEFTGKEKVSGSKRGDFIYAIGGARKIVIEAKDTGVNLKTMFRYMDEAITVRACEFGILVTRFPDQLEKQVGRMNMYGNRLFCCADDLEIALKFARMYMEHISGEKADDINVAAIKTALRSAITSLNGITQVKSKMTAITRNVTKEADAVTALVDEIKDNVLAQLEKVQEEITKEA